VKSPSDWRLVPKHTISDAITLGCVVQDQTLVVFGTGIHHLRKLIIGWKNSKKSLVQILSVLADVVAQSKHVINVRTNHGRHVHTVLSRHHKEYLPVSAIHKELADAHVPHEAFIIHTVVHEDEHGLTLADRQQLLLALYNLLKCITVIVSVNEQIRNELLVVTISLLRTRHGDPGWDVLLVPEDVSHERTLARPALSYENANLIIRHFRRVKLLELKRHLSFSFKIQRG